MMTLGWAPPSHLRRHHLDLLHSGNAHPLSPLNDVPPERYVPPRAFGACSDYWHIRNSVDNKTNLWLPHRQLPHRLTPTKALPPPFCRPRISGPVLHLPALHRRRDLETGRWRHRE